MKEPLLEVEDLHVEFPIYAGVLRHQVGAVHAVKGVSFSVHPGEILGVVGESGSGKSTAGRAAIRLITPTRGQVRYQGRDLFSLSHKEMRAVRRDLQMVFQDPASSLNPRMMVGEAVAEAVRFHGIVPEEDVWEYVGGVFDTVGLSRDQLQCYPHEFSGGQQQRICIGRAVALKPKLIVCDESVSALDISVQAQILNLLAQLREEMGLSYIFISHDLSVVRHISDRLVVMCRGEVVEAGDAEAVFLNPQHAYTRQLLSAEPVSHPRDRGKVKQDKLASVS